MKIETLLSGIAYRGDGTVEVNRIESDSRKVTEGCLFVCIKGYETDGHAYAEMAAQKGAAAILAQDEISVSCPVIYTENTRKAQAQACHVFHGKPFTVITLVLGRFLFLSEKLKTHSFQDCCVLVMQESEGTFLAVQWLRL